MAVLSGGTRLRSIRAHEGLTPSALFVILLTSQSLIISVPQSPASHSPPASGTPAPRRARRKEARPGELLDAALDLFVEKGYAATRVEEVAARAGVSKGTLFLYFPSKEELFKAVVRENIAGRFNGWNVELEQFEGSTRDMLRYFYTTWWQHVGATRASGLTKLMLSEAQNFPEITQFYQREVIEPAHQLIARMLRRGIERGEFRNVALDYAIFVVQAPMIFLMLWKHSIGACMPDTPGFSAEAYIESQVDNLLFGLLARPVELPTPSAFPSSHS